MFSYFTATIVLIFLGYAVIYPLLLWITPLNKIDRGFYRFNMGLSCIIGALGIIGFHFISKSLISEISDLRKSLLSTCAFLIITKAHAMIPTKAPTTTIESREPTFNRR